MINQVDIKLGRGRPRKFKIPDSFDCLGHTVVIKYVSPEDLGQYATGDTADTNCGLYDHQLKTIFLNNQLHGSALEQTFLHELEHCILFHMGQDRLSMNETFVDLHAELFYQFYMTQRGSNKK